MDPLMKKNSDQTFCQFMSILSLESIAELFRSAKFFDQRNQQLPIINASHPGQLTTGAGQLSLTCQRDQVLHLHPFGHDRACHG